jgi:hypothetical protein
MNCKFEIEHKNLKLYCPAYAEITFFSVIKKYVWGKNSSFTCGVDRRPNAFEFASSVVKRQVCVFPFAGVIYT